MLVLLQINLIKSFCESFDQGFFGRWFQLLKMLLEGKQHPRADRLYQYIDVGLVKSNWEIIINVLAACLVVHSRLSN